jgi:hypothetical protein
MIEESYIKNAVLSAADGGVETKFDNDKIYHLSKNFLISNKIIPFSVSILELSINMNGAELSMKCSDGNVYVIPWDFILHFFEPEYKYYIGIIKKNKGDGC